MTAVDDGAPPRRRAAPTRPATAAAAARLGARRDRRRGRRGASCRSPRRSPGSSSSPPAAPPRPRCCCCCRSCSPALGGLWAERAGMINIGLEGMMILGTWGAAWAGYQWGPWAAVVGGLVFGALGGLLHAVATVTFGVNHIVSGVAITLLGLGVTQVPVDADLPAALAEPAAVAAGRGLRDVLDPAARRLARRRWRPSSGCCSPTSPGCSAAWSPGSPRWSCSGSLLVPDQLLRAVAHPVRAAAALVRGEPGGRRVARREGLHLQVPRGDRLRRAGRPRRRGADAQPRPARATSRARPAAAATSAWPR